MTAIPSAAARVFGVAELLEDILLHVAHLEKEEVRKARPWSNGLEPVTQLFVLKRIDRTFNMTIKHSKKLSRFMYLANAPDSNKTDILFGQTFAPLEWFVLFLITKTDALEGMRFDIGEHGNGGTSFRGTWKAWSESEYIRTRADTGASWRDMRVSNVDYPGPKAAYFQLVSNRSAAEKARGVQKEETRCYEIGGNETMGEVFDMVVEAREVLHGKIMNARANME